MADDRLKAFYDKEINEIVQNKLRFGVIIASLAVSLAIFIFTDTEAEVTSAAVDIESPAIVESSANSKDDKSNKPSAKVTSITGLERAAEGVELINPFKSDLVKPPAEVRTPEPSTIPLPNLPKNEPIKPAETNDKIVLTLKGTAISGNKKMAIIQRSVVDKDSETSKDKSKNESMLLNIGDEIEGRRIVNIDKDFVTFDDGHQLHLQEALR